MKIYTQSHISFDIKSAEMKTEKKRERKKNTATEKIKIKRW